MTRKQKTTPLRMTKGREFGKIEANDIIMSGRTP
jgi:hypothetical protein